MCLCVCVWGGEGVSVCVCVFLCVCVRESIHISNYFNPFTGNVALLHHRYVYGVFAVCLSRIRDR